MMMKARVAASKELKLSERTLDKRLEGITLGDIEEGHPYHGKINGVIITEIQRGSRAWSAGLRKGDIITSVNHKPVTDLQVFLQLVDNNENTLLFRVITG